MISMFVECEIKEVESWVWMSESVNDIQIMKQINKQINKQRIHK